MKFLRKRKKERNSDIKEKDSGELSQAMIIIAALAVAVVVVIGLIAGASLTKGEESARCISEFSTFDSGAVDENCAINASNNEGTLPPGGDENIVPGEPIDEDEEQSIVEYTPDECFEVANNTLIKYLIVESPIICGKDVVIPEEINGERIEAIGEMAFVDAAHIVVENGERRYLFAINSVVIPSTVKTIGHAAFAYNNLESVNIPDSVTSISDYAFAYNQLTNVNIPDSVTNIADGAFASNQLTNINIPNSVTSIGDSAFRDNEIVNLYIPDNVESIGAQAFNNNPLQSLRITENPNYTTIESGTFSFFCGVTGACTGKPNASNIDLLEIPNNIKTIESRAFEKMQIRELTIPSGVETIKDSVFSRTGVERVNFNDGLISIGSSSFYANNLEELVLPETLEIIESDAFAINRSLLNNNDLVIPYSVKEIGAGAFTSTGGDYREPSTVMIPHHTNYYPDDGSRLKSFDEFSVNIVRY